MINYKVPDLYKAVAEFQAEQFLQSIQFPPMNLEIRGASFYRSMESNQYIYNAKNNTFAVWDWHIYF